MRRAEDLSCVTPSGLTQFADPTTLQSAAPYLAAWATFGRTGPTPICERITPVYAAPGGLARSVQVQRSPATETPFGGTSAYSAPTRSARTTPTRSGSAPGPTRSTTRDRRRRAVTGSRLPVLIRVISGGQCQADRSAVSLPMSAATGTGAQPGRHREMIHNPDTSTVRSLAWTRPGGRRQHRSHEPPPSPEKEPALYTIATTPGDSSTCAPGSTTTRPGTGPGGGRSHRV